MFHSFWNRNFILRFISEFHRLRIEFWIKLSYPYTVPIGPGWTFDNHSINYDYFPQIIELLKYELYDKTWFPSYIFKNAQHWNFLLVYLYSIVYSSNPNSWVGEKKTASTKLDSFQLLLQRPLNLSFCIFQLKKQNQGHKSRNTVILYY